MGGTYVVTVKDGDELIRAQEHGERKLLQAIRAAQIDSAQATLAAVVQDTNAEGLVDTGVLKNSWDIAITKDEVRVENDAPYASPRLEEGARPFRPPLKPLADWAERKAGALGIVSLRPGQRFRGRASLNDEQRKAAMRIAKAIQEKYAREGIKPRYLMRGRIPYAIQQLRRALDEHIDKVAKNPRG